MSYTPSENSQKSGFCQHVPCGFNHPRMAEGLTRGCFRGSLAPRGFPDIKHGLIWRKQVEAAMAGLEFQDVSSMFQMLKPKKQSPQATWTFFTAVRKFQDQTSSKGHLACPWHDQPLHSHGVPWHGCTVRAAHVERDHRWTMDGIHSTGVVEEGVAPRAGG